MLEGLLGLSVWALVGVTLLLTHITIASVTIYLHRHQAHRALDLHPVASHFFRFWLWLSTGMRTRDWVAIHRKHHAKCETADDPHSPQVLGLKKVLWQGAELYREEAGNQSTIEQYGKGTPDDWMERNVYRRPGVGVSVMLLVDLALFGIAGLSVWGVQMLWIPFWAAGVINGIGHYWGYRNYECRDAATNIVPWGILIGGEELHNNHHTYAGSAKLSSKPWEFDIGWMYIRLLEMAGLAQVKKVAPTAIVGPVKPAVDLDILRAVTKNRFQVMARYAGDVLLPVCAAECRQAQAATAIWLKRARKLLVRNHVLLTDRDRCVLERALGSSADLQVVYTYKERLWRIWEESGANEERLLYALQSWCRRAEATRVAMLEEFARNLRGYTLQGAPAR
ncbi:MAG TPA: fatty acid desaturase [Gammaproteobacteria bacterium]|nr:fatty acid desaturase [Gammaproteobacteria bacterium]